MLLKKFEGIGAWPPMVRPRAELYQADWCDQSGKKKSGIGTRFDFPLEGLTGALTAHSSYGPSTAYASPKADFLSDPSPRGFFVRRLSFPFDG